MHRDPGYVLVSYAGHTFQTSLWLLLALIVAGAIGVRYGYRFIAMLISSGGRISAWRIARRKEKATSLTMRGMALMCQGEFERAERYLVSGLDYSEVPAMNLLWAARSANAEGRADKRDEYLQQAASVDNGLGSALAVAGAEMAITRRDWGQALTFLTDAPDNDHVLLMRARTLSALEHWHDLKEYLPSMIRVGGDELMSIARSCALSLVTLEVSTDGERRKQLDRLPSELISTEVILACVQQLSKDSAKEQMLKRSLDQKWHPDLVVAYGQLGSDTLTARLKAMNGWRSGHSEDADYHLGLGLMLEQSNDYAKAQKAYERSLALSPRPLASERLGLLASFEGDYKRGSEYLKQAIRR